jgi:serine/threonine protein kinase
VSDQTLAVGTRLDDFQITAVLGQGGFGVTYKAIDERLQRDVAIKEYLPRQFAFRDETATVRPRGPQDQEVFTWGLTRFIDEARALALFKHPNIVAVIRYLEANGTAYLVMEYEEGKDLERWLAGRSEAVPEQMLIERILLPLLDGLAKIHQKGLLHRDIKPENVFIRRDGSPVLIDFGSSRAHGEGQSNTLTSIISAGYSPFEQYGGAQRQGPWSDLYALGGTLYRIVCGGPPTDAIARHQGIEQPSALSVGAGRYSEQLLRAIDQSLAIDPAERPQSATELIALLPGHVASVSPDQSATQVRRPIAAPPQRRWLPVAIGSVLLLSVASGVVWYIERGLPGTPPVVAESAQQTTPEIDPSAPSSDPIETRDAASSPVPAADSNAAGDAGPIAEPPAAVDERAILAGWSLPDDVDNYRSNQIAGGLLAYTSNKEKFDACLAVGCADLATLMGKIEEALRGYEWSKAGYHGSIRLDNPRTLTNPDCPFLIDVAETITSEGATRSQQRSYCTRDGFDRRVEHAGVISDQPVVGTAS